MKKTAVVYWSGTGNTAAMAELVLEGMREAGADASLIECTMVTDLAMTPSPSAAPPWAPSSWRTVSLSPCSTA